MLIFCDSIILILEGFVSVSNISCFLFKLKLLLKKLKYIDL